jgi:serine/threonine protein kinase/tetratricopeptide (TPR) repeat protein
MSLVELALAQPREERDSYIESACGGDTELIGAVRKYVGWEERMDGFLLDPLYAAPNVEQPFERGEMLAGRFRIVREVDEGGMGIVYEAVDERLERRIAIKCAKSGFRKRLPPEVRHASEIAHPNVCKIHEIHSAYTSRGEIDFLTMEFLEGETLAQRLQRGRLKEEQARAIARQLCAGLAEAHRHQVVHGDLKCNNVILARDADGTERAVITDFGLARGPVANAARGRAQSLEAGGSPDYMAPELWKGEKASPASDVYALGVILCELAVGRRPFGPDVPLEERLKRKPPAIHPKWDRVFSRCLDPDPLRRFSNALEVAKALDPVRSRWWLTSAAGVLLAAVVGGMTYEQVSAHKESWRLAMAQIESSSPVLAGFTSDLSTKTANHLARLKGGAVSMSFIPPDKIGHNRPTHILRASLTPLNGKLFLTAKLTDERSGEPVTLKDLKAEYTSGEQRYIPVALAGMVTATLRLPPLDVVTKVNSAASADYSTGMSYLRQASGVDAAIFYLSRAVQLDPDSPLAYAGLAEGKWFSFYATKDPATLEGARDAERQAERRNPDLAPVHRILGLLLSHDGLVNLAESEYRRAIDLEPGNGDAYRRLGMLYEPTQPELALTQYKQATQKAPDDYRNFQILGTFYYNRSKFSDAVKPWETAVKLAPAEPVLHYGLGGIYMDLGKFPEAQSELWKSLSQRKMGLAYQALGMTQMYLENDQAAVDFFQKAIDLDAAGGMPYVSLMYKGIAYHNLHMTDLEKETNEKGLQAAVQARHGNDSSVEVVVGFFDACMGNTSRAKSEIDQAVETGREDYYTRWRAVFAYERLGLRADSLRVLSSPATTADFLEDLNRWPGLQSLHEDRSFKDLLAVHHVTK